MTKKLCVYFINLEVSNSREFSIKYTSFAERDTFVYGSNLVILYSRIPEVFLKLFPLLTSGENFQFAGRQILLSSFFFRRNKVATPLTWRLQIAYFARARRSTPPLFYIFNKLMQIHGRAAASARSSHDPNQRRLNNLPLATYLPTLPTCRKPQRKNVEFPGGMFVQLRNFHGIYVLCHFCQRLPMTASPIPSDDE